MRLRDFLLLPSILLSLPVLTLGEEPAPKPAAAKAQPVAVAEPTVKELGTVAVGDPLSAEFTVRNEGSAPLELQSAKAAPEVHVEGLPAKVPAGGTQKIKIALPGRVPPGPISVDAEVATNDPDHGSLKLGLRATVRAYLLVEPGYARYIVVQYATDGTIAQTVGADDGATFHVLKVDVPNPALRASFHEVAADERRPDWKGSQWKVELTLPKDAPVGALTGEMVVVTDHPRQPTARIPVSGFVRPVLAVTPPEAVFGVVEAASGRDLRLFVKNFAAGELEIKEAAVDIPGVTATVAPIQAGRTWNLTLHVAPHRALGPFTGKLRIRTSDANVPPTEVSVEGRVDEAIDPAIPAAVVKKKSS